ncbi:MAG: hypothetical protein SP1CHLAM54_00700 [Chlamydiia bacterium]|nr:hypothetical protein [Chlamydiia bacterium]MCH9614992.1 hypothetical protein [Chlamydiia bacterium]MCH9629958.1 hypothetical protein [Chlamydiia bacterium]
MRIDTAELFEQRLYARDANTQSIIEQLSWTVVFFSINADSSTKETLTHQVRIVDTWLATNPITAPIQEEATKLHQAAALFLDFNPQANPQSP